MNVFLKPQVKRESKTAHVNINVVNMFFGRRRRYGFQENDLYICILLTNLIRKTIFSFYCERYNPNEYIKNTFLGCQTKTAKRKHSYQTVPSFCCITISLKTLFWPIAANFVFISVVQSVTS